MVDQADAEGHESENCSAVMMTDSHDGDNGMYDNTIIRKASISSGHPKAP